MKYHSFWLLGLLLVNSMMAKAETKNEQPQVVKHQVTGLFAPEREKDLRDVFGKIPNVTLVSIDFKNAEITCEYVPAKVFSTATAEQVIERLDNLVKSASNHTFGIKALSKVPADKLKWIEIPVVGLDCKACSLAAYEVIYKLDGVERATASFRDGRITALIDPTKTDRSKLEAILKQREVQVKAP